MAILAETVEKSSEIAIRDSYRTQPVSAYPKIDTRFRGDAERRRQGRTHHCRGVNFGLSADSHHGGDTVHFDSGQLQFEFSVQPFGRRHFQPARHIHPNFVFAGGTPVQITHRQNHRYAERVGQTRTHTDVEILPQLIDENDSAVGQYAAPCYLTRHGINAATQRGDQAPSFGDGAQVRYVQTRIQNPVGIQRGGRTLVLKRGIRTIERRRPCDELSPVVSFHGKRQRVPPRKTPHCSRTESASCFVPQRRGREVFATHIALPEKSGRKADTDT